MRLQEKFKPYWSLLSVLRGTDPRVVFRQNGAHPIWSPHRCVLCNCPSQTEASIRNANCYHSVSKSHLSQSSPRGENKEGLQSRNGTTLLPLSMYFLIFFFIKQWCLGESMGLPGPPRFPEFIKLTMNRRDARSCSLVKKQTGWISPWRTKGSPGLPAGGACEVHVHTPQRRPQVERQMSQVGVILPS